MKFEIRKILIVDSDLQFMSKVKSALGRMNLEVKLTNSEFKLFHLIDSFKPDMILVNKNALCVDPSIITEELKSNPSTADIQVVQYLRRQGDNRFINVPASNIYEFAFSEN